MGNYVLCINMYFTKSLYISETFPAKEWSSISKLNEISINFTERILAAVSIAMLVLSAFIEAILIIGF